MPMLTIRPALPSDAVALQALARAIWNAVYPSIITQAQIDFMLEQMYNPAQIATEMDTGYRWKWVESDGVAIGFISTLIENGDTLMPPFKEVLETPQIQDVVAYVKTL